MKEEKTSIVRAVIDLGYNSSNNFDFFQLTLYTPTFYEREILIKLLEKLDYIEVEYSNYFDSYEGFEFVFGNLKKYRLLSNKNNVSIPLILDDYFSKGSYIHYFVTIRCKKTLREKFANDLEDLLNSANMTLVDRVCNDSIVKDYLGLFNKSYKTAAIKQ